MTEQEKEQARIARNAYQREWRKKNRDKVKQIQERYWMRRVQGKKEEASNNADVGL